MVAVDKDAINDSQVLVVTENGYGKRTKLVDEDGEDVYRTNRGGKGVKTLNITEKTGNLISINAVTDADDLMIINKSGLTIRMAVEDLRVMGRATQGVKLIKGKDSIAAVTKVMKDDPEEVIDEEDGNIVEEEAIERVKPVLEVLEDEGSAEDDEDDDSDDEEVDDESDEDDADDEA
jgi:DNA gyrase subunit A